MDFRASLRDALEPGAGKALEKTRGKYKGLGEEGNKKRGRKKEKEEEEGGWEEREEEGDDERQGG